MTGTFASSGADTSMTMATNRKPVIASSGDARMVLFSQLVARRVFPH